MARQGAPRLLALIPRAALKAWERADVPISLAETGGHEVRYPGRRTFPYKVLLKHFLVERLSGVGVSRSR
jgi:hypothetical protein